MKRFVSSNNDGRNINEPRKLQRRPNETIVARVLGVDANGPAVKRMGTAAKTDVPLERKSGMNLVLIAESIFCFIGISEGSLSIASMMSM